MLQVKVILHLIRTVNFGQPGEIKSAIKRVKDYDFEELFDSSGLEIVEYEVMEVGRVPIKDYEMASK